MHNSLYCFSLILSCFIFDGWVLLELRCKKKKKKKIIINISISELHFNYLPPTLPLTFQLLSAFTLCLAAASVLSVSTQDVFMHSAECRSPTLYRNVYSPTHNHCREVRIIKENRLSYTAFISFDTYSSINQLHFDDFYCLTFN